MEEDFWHNAWENGRQGWHQSSVNLHLETWWENLQTNKSDPVFVPLCGKSKDMLWLLEQGHPVTGVEINEGAVATFFDENQILHTREDVHGFQLYSNKDLKIFTGDFFKLSGGQLKQIKLVFDRAALIALPPAMRQDYAAKMAEILPIGCKIFLITVVYDQSKMSGPPFSVEDEEVYGLFEASFNVNKVESSDDPALLGGLLKRGLSSLIENVWFISKTN